MRTAAGVFFILLVLGGAPPALSAQEPDARALEAARERLLASGRYETRLPEPRELEPSGIDLGVLGQILGFLAIVLLAITLIVLIGLAARGLADRKRRRLAATQPPGEILLENVALEVDLAEIDRLARARRYSEAIHLLLLRTIGELVRVARIDIKPAWTSREIAASIPLGPEPREDLRDLVHRAELGHFAEFESEEQDYVEARSIFERLVARLKGQGA